MQTLGLRRALPSLRFYSTNKALPEGALAARTASTPLAVRLRRRKKLGPVQPGKTDANHAGLTPTEVARYNRLRALGEIPKVDGRPISPYKWIMQVNEKRSRIRGFKTTKAEDGTEVVQAVGQRVYLPNIIFKLVRNFTPPGEPYNPYEATFRIPKSVTKTDIRSYLEAAYGVKTTYIRTDNYYSPEFPRRGTIAHKSYKRAVVGLVDPFYYPHRLEDMAGEQKTERKKWLEEQFALKQLHQERKGELLRRTMGHGSANFRFKPENATRRSNILRLVAERKFEREKLLSQFAGEMKERRGKGELVNYEALQGYEDKTSKEVSNANATTTKS